MKASLKLILNVFPHNLYNLSQEKWETRKHAVLQYCLFTVGFRIVFNLTFEDHVSSLQKSMKKRELKRLPRHSKRCENIVKVLNATLGKLCPD